MIMVVGAEAVHSQQTSDAYPRMMDHIFLDVAKVSGQRGALFCHCKIDQSVVVDISATQSVKFLDLVWATALGWLIFGDVPSQWTWMGGVVICASTLWIARRESKTLR